MKKAVLHIGRHKTGTTTLQWALEASRAELADIGAVYPNAGRGDPAAHLSPGHHRLSALLNAEAPPPHELARMRSELLREAEDFETIILSSEGFQNIVDLSRVSALLDGFSITTIGYLRESLGYCVSSYAEEILNSATCIDFEAFADNFNRVLDVEWFVKQWESISEKATWRLFDRQTLKSADIVADFRATIGLVGDAPAIYTRGERNYALGGNALFFKRLINVLGEHSPRHVALLQEAARGEAKFRGAFQISKADQDRLRAANPCNETLRRMFENVPLRDFRTERPMFDPEEWERDYRILLSKYYENDVQAVSHPVLKMMSRYPR